jgi:DNA helicase-2/ATP-dependent DNA helicase PcrA
MSDPGFIEEKETLAKVVTSIVEMTGGIDLDRIPYDKIWETMGGADERSALVLLELTKQRNITLLEMKRKPYYGRVDFIENGIKNSVYFGQSSLDLPFIKVVSWKSPLGSIFPEANYPKPIPIKTPSGLLSITPFLKRHLIIDNSVLKDLETVLPPSEKSVIVRNRVSTAISVLDKESVSISRTLTKILEQRGDPKVNEIYETIQLEQNRIMRLPYNTVLIINGVAGSGKTSIGYHRLAYLLYEQNDFNLNSKKVIIFGPNKVFLGFMKSLLPALNVSGVKEATFDDWACEKIGLDSSALTDFTTNKFVESNLPKEEKKKLWKRSKVKGSLGYAALIKEYAKYLNSLPPDFQDLDVSFPANRYKQVSITKIEQLDIWKTFGSSIGYYDKYVDFEKTILGLVEYRVKQRDPQSLDPDIISKNNYLSDEARNQLKNKAKSTIESMKTKASQEISNRYKPPVKSLFNRMFAQLWKINSSIKTLSQQRLKGLVSVSSIAEGDLEDLPAIMYLQFLLGPNQIESYDYIVVDEGQDFSPLQYLILKEINPTQRMTIMGDVNQGIVAHRGINSWDEVKDIFDVDVQIETLRVSYRPTKEIVIYTAEVLRNVYGNKLKEENIPIPYQRSGKQPEIHLALNEDMLRQDLINLLKSFDASTTRSIGILTKTETEAKTVFNWLTNRSFTPKLVVDRNDNRELTEGITVLPITLSKGLEFEKLIMYDVSKNKFDNSTEYDGRLLYVGLTRALHELYILSEGKESNFISRNGAKISWIN